MPAKPPVFERLDAGLVESELCRRLSAFLTFGNHALYFTQDAIHEPEYIAAEGRLLLPVAAADAATAVLRLDDVPEDGVREIWRHLPNIVALAFENIELAQAQGKDRGTGLHSEAALLDFITARIEAIQSGSVPLKDACLGLIAIYWPDAQELEARTSSQAFYGFFSQMAKIFARSLPSGAMGARLGMLEGRAGFAALFPATGRAGCDNLAGALLDALEQLRYSDPLSDSRASPVLCAGHALYPQDLGGADLLANPNLQALKFRNRARLAADVAWQTERLKRPVLAFAWIAATGARIAEVLPHGCARINLGRNANIQPGQRFHVIGKDSRWDASESKGQIIVGQPRENDALAEIFYIRQAGNPPLPGDGLLPVQPEAGGAERLPGGLLQQEDFLTRFALRRKNCDTFALAITQFWSGETESANNTLEQARAAFKQKLLDFMESFFPQELRSGFAGRYGWDGTIIFLPEAPAGTVSAFFEHMHEIAAQAGLGAASGIFIYPFLNFSRQDSETNALKALEYASLLPAPHIGFMDALALAINADKRFSQGDELGALEEYRQALLLKPGDAVILNSLGVCLASLGRMEDARGKFMEARAKCAEPGLRAQISYNLGNLFRKENDLPAARACYKDCIKAEPEHIYAWARLGQIYAKAGRPGPSRALYMHAARLAQTQPDTLNMIQRQMAKLETQRNQTEKARELLHDSLLRNPTDHAALLLLAQTYLSDDPAMAETLARKCLLLGADARLVLADALIAQGRHEEARKVSQRGK